MSSFSQHTSHSETSKYMSLRLLSMTDSAQVGMNHTRASQQDRARPQVADSSSLRHWDEVSAPFLLSDLDPGPDVGDCAYRTSADSRSISWQGQVAHPVGQSSANPLHPPNRTSGQYSYSLMSWDALDATSRPPSQSFLPRSGASVQSPPPMNSGASSSDLRLHCNGFGFFDVHREVLASASSNHFRHVVSPSMESTLKIDENYDVMYVILDAIYSVFTMYKFTSEGRRKQDMELPLLLGAVERMIVYGVQPGDFIRQSSLLYKCLYQHTPLHPLDIFTLAAHYRIEALAVQTSSHLLSLNLDTVSDQCRRRIGPGYYNRLLSLHTDRLDALKLIVTDPPVGHPYTLLCTDSDQDDMVNLWNSGMSIVRRDATPYLSPQFLVAQMRPYQAKVNCVTCDQHFTARLSDVAEEWSKVKCTI